MRDTSSEIELEIKDHIGILTMSRPPHNFTDLDFITSLADTLWNLSLDNEVWTIVLAAKGKSFSAGADFSQGGVAPETPDVHPVESFRLGTRKFYDQAIRILRAPLPIVGAINGAAVGAGLGLVLACDFKVAATEAWFCAPFVKLGIHPGFGISSLLPKLIGDKNANDMLLSGRRVRANEALAFHLVDEVVEKDEVLGKAIEVAGKLIQSSPMALRSTRKTLRDNFLGSIEDILIHELDKQCELIDTNDAREGVAASLERRSAKYTNS
ncbi:MAG: enoyl-CoA hydratase/isomerase family protein [Acidimicrobiales bacterium]|nr:enoyl-CoA hydratase/isomerase family protein [Acidimicrobiales bacterium]